MRVVLDTNVLLAALFTRGLCEALLDICIAADAITIILSNHILEEFSRNASQKFGAPQPDVASAIRFLKEHAEMVEPAPLPEDICPDPDDVPVLGTAVAGNADALITGDNHLLQLEGIEGIEILSPRALYERL